MAAFYPHAGSQLSVATVAVSAGVLFVLTIVSLGFARRHPWLIVAWLWYLGTLVPMLGLVQVGLQARADRYSDLPMMGLSLIVCGGLAALSKRVPNAWPVVKLLAAFMVLALMGRSIEQLSTWKNSQRVYQRVLAVTPNCAWALNGLGSAHLVEQQPPLAEGYFKQAVELDPGLASAWLNLGLIARERGELPTAATMFERGVNADGNNLSLRTNLGLVLVELGRSADAITHLQLVADCQPTSLDAQINLAIAFDGNGQHEEARQRFAAGLKLARKQSPQALLEAGMPYLDFLRRHGQQAARQQLTEEMLLIAEQLGRVELVNELKSPPSK